MRYKLNIMTKIMVNDSQIKLSRNRFSGNSNDLCKFTSLTHIVISNNRHKKRLNPLIEMYRIS